MSFLSFSNEWKDGLETFLLTSFISVRCSSPNEEPLHWMKVLKLYSEYYFINDPFEVPTKDMGNVGLPRDVGASTATTPTKARVRDDARSPVLTETSKSSVGAYGATHTHQMPSSPGSSVYSDTYSTSIQGSSPQRPNSALTVSSTPHNSPFFLFSFFLKIIILLTLLSLYI